MTTRGCPLNCPMSCSTWAARPALISLGVKGRLPTSAQADHAVSILMTSCGSLPSTSESQTCTLTGADSSHVSISLASYTITLRHCFFFFELWAFAHDFLSAHRLVVTHT